MCCQYVWHLQTHKPESGSITFSIEIMLCTIEFSAFLMFGSFLHLIFMQFQLCPYLLIGNACLVHESLFTIIILIANKFVCAWWITCVLSSGYLVINAFKMPSTSDNNNLFMRLIYVCGKLRMRCLDDTCVHTCSHSV